MRPGVWGPSFFSFSFFNFLINSAASAASMQFTALIVDLILTGRLSACEGAPG